MKTYSQLLNNVIGQLNGVKNMIENDEDCFKTLTQLKAAKSALNSLTRKFLEQNFIKCIEKGYQSKEDVCKMFFNQIIE